MYVCTFEPYGLSGTGNGYFAAWAALFLSVTYAQGLFEADGGFVMPKMSSGGGGPPRENAASADAPAGGDGGAKMEEGQQQPPVAMAVAVPVEQNPGVAHQRGDSASAI